MSQHVLQWLDEAATLPDANKTRIIDYSQYCIAAVMGSQNKNPTQSEMCEYIAKGIQKAFLNYYGTKVLAIDGQNNWRKKVYKEYKASRRDSKDKSDFDWLALFEAMKNTRAAIDKFTDIKVVFNNNLEADDVMFCAAKHYKDLEIWSSDKDFFQLHRPGVVQYSLHKHEYLEEKDPSWELSNQIMRGDSADGVPNCLSQDDVFLNKGVRQSPIRKADAEKWFSTCDQNGYPTEETFLAFESNNLFKAASRNGLTSAQFRERIERNINMVDLSQSPQEYQKDVMEQFETEKYNVSLESYSAWCFENGFVLKG